MPALLSLDSQDRRAWLCSYHDTHLLRDLADLARLSDLEPFFRFQRLAAPRSGKLLSFGDLARDAGTSPTPARNDLEYLRISYQAFLLPPYGHNLTSTVVKSPKLFWTDLGICRHLQGHWGPLTGELFATLVVGEAMKLVRTLALEVHPAFYRTRSGLEVDLLLDTPAGIIALEAKARPGWSPADFRSLRALAAALAERLLAGILVTTGKDIVSVSERPPLWVVPLQRLFA